MGNQSGKIIVNHRGSKFIDTDVDAKNSRTNWIAGVASAPGRPKIELSSRVSAPEDDSVTDEINLTWDVPEDDGGYPITGYRVEMLDISSGKWIEVTFIEGYEPKCTLSNILYGIMYRFRVVAINDAGPSEAGEPSEPVVIDVPGVQIAPYFVAMLNDTIALEHEKVEFRVRVLGTPKPSIQWYKDDVEIFACDRIEMREEEEGGAVILKAARLSDSGVIKCVASNILGRCTSTAQFSIEAAPRFEMPENYNEGLIFRHEEVIRLRVPMIAKPAPKVVWFFEDEPISAGSDLIIETKDNFTSLRIEGAKRWHCGEFRVYAENEYGEDASSILVTVTSPPSPPGRPVVIDISETKCTLRWEPSEDDGGADVKHYIVEYFRDVWEVWLKAKTTKDTLVTIDDLIPGSRYKFRIKAENSYGISEPGDESDPFDVGGVSAERREDSWIGSPTPDIQVEEAPPQDAKEETPEIPTAPKRKSNMAKAKEQWGSDEPDEDILDRFLKVKKFQESQAPSYESDGIPSIADIDEERTTSTDKNVRRLYDELQQFSYDSVHPDLESVLGTEDEEDMSSKSDLRRARELYEELRQMSVETGGSIENLMEGINTSHESVASIIPYEKRQELSKFELSLKQMIEEAKQMATTPTSGSEEDLSYRKSPSVHSLAESIVSVIERRNSSPRYIQKMVEDNNNSELPIPPKRGAKRTPSPLKIHQYDQSSPAPPPQPPSPIKMAPPTPQSSMRRAAPPSPVMHQETSAKPPQTLIEAFQQKSKDAQIQLQQQQQQRRSSMVKTISNGSSQEQNKPLFGADRYEEIIEARGRCSRGSSVISGGPRSVQGSMTNLFQPGTTMAMREESKQRSSLNHSRPGSMNKLNGSGLSNSGGLILPDLSKTPSRPTSGLSVNAPSATVKVPSPQPVLVKRPGQQKSEFKATQIQPSIDPIRPETTEAFRKHHAALVKTSYPDWLLITLAYSAVFVSILLLSNIIPNGRLYIHFTAFWSLILYFKIDDLDNNQSTDVLETVMENFVKVKK